MSEVNLKNIKNDVLDNVFLKQIGLRVVVIIRRRTLSGKFLSGSESYSTKPFAMPLGAASKTLGKLLRSQKSFAVNRGKGKEKTNVSADEYQVFTAKSGALWVIIGGGYKRFREMGGRQSSKVDLSWSGRMLRNLGVLPGSEKHNEVSVGFTSEDEKQKARWHNVLGAGKSKSKHEFMGLTPDEQNELARYADAELVKKINSALKKLN